MSKRHTHIITEKTEILIECPLDSINGLTDLVSGQDIVGKSSGDIVWDATQQTYQFKTQNTAQGSKGIYLENIQLPQSFDWTTWQYGATFDVKRVDNTGGAFVCTAFWYGGSLNRCDAPVYVYYSGGNEINLNDQNWHHVDVIWTPTAKDEYLDGNYVMSEPYTQTTWNRRQYLVYDKFMVCGTPWSTSGIAFMKNLKVWRERL